MQIGIVSDTHDNLDIVERAVDVFEAESVERVVHCGDIVAPFAATAFDSEFEFFAVRGNNDGEWALQSVIDEFGTYLGEAGELTVGGVSFAVYHGTSRVLVDALVESGRYDYVCHGHTHEFAREERAGTVRVNPGGIPIDGAPETPYAVVIDTETDTFERFALRA